MKQCAKCPWKVSTDPHDIPNGYSEDLHQALAGTVAEPGSLCDTGHVVACHEHPPGEEAHCIGWLMQQVGPGNSIPLLLKLWSCENLDAVALDGPQHERFQEAW